jgi:hypothetical protein
MIKSASNLASSEALENMPNAASTWLAKRRHEGPRQLHQTERPIPVSRRAKFGCLLGKTSGHSPDPIKSGTRDGAA